MRILSHSLRAWKTPKNFKLKALRKKLSHQQLVKKRLMPLLRKALTRTTKLVPNLTTVNQLTTLKPTLRPSMPSLLPKQQAKRQTWLTH